MAERQAALDFERMAESRAPAVRTEDDKRKERGNARKMLDLMAAEPGRKFSSIELVEKVSHRFGAALFDLRNEGHIIPKRRGERVLTDGTIERTWFYWYERHVPMLKMPSYGSAVYYQMSHWQAKRWERMKHDEWKCCHCRTLAGLQVHHWQYDLFNEHLEDLVTLCGECHLRVHNYPGVRISFPKRAYEHIVRQIIVEKERHERNGE